MEKYAELNISQTRSFVPFSPSMIRHTDTIFIEQVCELTGKTPSGLAIAIGVVPSTLNRFTRPVVMATHQLSMDTIRKIAEYIGISLDKVIAHREGIERSTKQKETIPNIANIKKQYSFSRRNEKSELNIAPAVQSQFGPDTIPILGNASGSPDAIILNFDEQIGRALRHPNQSGVDGAFALYARGESMSPRYMPGELVYVATNRPPTKGQDCVIELNNGESYLKQYSKTTGKELICHQLNPSSDWKRPTSEIKAIHAVVGRG